MNRYSRILIIGMILIALGIVIVNYWRTSAVGIVLLAIGGLLFSIGVAEQKMMGKERRGEPK